jgi:hypothetical protein
MKTHLIILLFTGFTTSSFAFDLEDYATTYRATRDAHMKAQSEWTDANNSMNQLKNYLKANCLQIEDASGFSYSNVNGLMSGSCNRDNESAHATGGVLPRVGKLKFGDKIGRILELQPAFSQYSISSLNSSTASANSFPVGDLEDFATMYRASRDASLAAKKQLIEMNSRVTKIPGCVKTNSTVQGLVDAQVTAEITNNATLDPVVVGRAKENLIFQDFNTKYQAMRGVLYTKTVELLLSTAPHVAAREAYKASVAVYVHSLSCNPETGINANDRLLYDPYSPEINPF